MAFVKTEVFRQTLEGITTPLAVNTLVDTVNADANAFIGTLQPDRVLDIRTEFSGVGKYGPLTHYQIMVIYLVP